MPVNFSVDDKDMGFDDMMDALSDPSADHVVVGIMAEAGEEIVRRAVTHEFGGTISVKGGVSYGYRTEKEAEAGKVRFMKKGQGFMELGKTEAHDIVIPERSFIRGTIDQKGKEIASEGEKLLTGVLDGKMSKEKALDLWGMMAQDAIKKGITSRSLGLQEKAKSTLRKNPGKTTPLINEGHMYRAIDHEVRR